MNTHLIQLIDISSYRLSKIMDNAQEDFLDFDPGHGARSPRALLEHMVEVTFYGLSIIDEDESTESGEVYHIVRQNLNLMRHALASRTLSDETSSQLINGPLSDLLTHIGQLAMLRRLSNDPIVWENYTLAKTDNCHALR